MYIPHYSLNGKVMGSGRHGCLYNIKLVNLMISGAEEYGFLPVSFLMKCIVPNRCRDSHLHVFQ
jgi:hypothetical protein